MYCSGSNVQVQPLTYLGTNVKCVKCLPVANACLGQVATLVLAEITELMFSTSFPKFCKTILTCTVAGVAYRYNR